MLTKINEVFENFAIVKILITGSCVSLSYIEFFIIFVFKYFLLLFSKYFKNIIYNNVLLFLVLPKFIIHKIQKYHKKLLFIMIHSKFWVFFLDTGHLKIFYCRQEGVIK